MTTAAAITTTAAPAAAPRGPAVDRGVAAAGGDSFGAVLARTGADVAVDGTAAGTVTAAVRRATDPVGIEIDEETSDVADALAGIATFPTALLLTIPGLLPTIAAAVPTAESDVTAAAGGVATATTAADTAALVTAAQTRADAALAATTADTAARRADLFATPQTRLPTTPTVPAEDSPAPVRTSVEPLPTADSQSSDLPAPTAATETPTNPLGTGSPLRRFGSVPAQIPIVAGLGQQPVPPEVAPTEPGAPPVAAVSAVSGPPAVAPVDVGTNPRDRFAALTIQGQTIAGTVAPRTTVPPTTGPVLTPIAATATPPATAPSPFAGLFAQGTTVSTATADPFATPAAPFAPQAPVEKLAESPDAKPIDNSFGTFLPSAPPAAANPTPTVSAPPSAAATPAVQVGDAVVSHARSLEPGGAVEFRMRLDPPDLGRLQVRLVSSGDRVDGHLVVANDAVRGLIEAQLPELRQRLEAAGLTVQSFDVTTDPGGGRNPGTGAGDRPAPGYAAFDRDPFPPVRPRGRTAVAASAGRLDVTA